MQNTEREDLVELRAAGDELVALWRKLVEFGRDPGGLVHGFAIGTDIDDGATARAVDGRLRFKPSEGFLEALAALRRAADEIE